MDQPRPCATHLAILGDSMARHSRLFATSGSNRPPVLFVRAILSGALKICHLGIFFASSSGTRRITPCSIH
jgi:hypothetical protein